MHGVQPVFVNSIAFLRMIDVAHQSYSSGRVTHRRSQEPQFWYNVTPHLSFGSEIEISNNFVYNTYNDKSFFINPTIAAKWNF